jgi:hypothetical protein
MRPGIRGQESGVRNQESGVRSRRPGWVGGCLVAAVLSLAGFLPPSMAHAASEADADKPYKVQLVLHFSEHRMLTKAFRAKVERELHDDLQAALGEMGQVEVVYEHPKLNEIMEKGPGVLDNWRDLDGVKTHFVLIDFKDGQYEIQARQHDGYTGLASHLRSPERTDNRQLVSRAALLLLERDFGAVGVVEPIDGASARVTFKASALDGSVERWVKKGDILALVQVKSPTTWSLIPNKLLQAPEDPKEGKCVCVLLPGDAKPLPPASYLAIKLGTGRAPLRALFVNAAKKTPEKLLPVQVRHHNFKEEVVDKGATDDRGYFSTDGRKTEYDHVAFVSCLVNDVLYQIAIPIFEEGAVTCTVPFSQDQGTQLLFDRTNWERMMLETDQMQGELLKELGRADPEKREANLEQAKKGLEALEGDLRQHERKREELIKHKMDPKAGQTRLQDLQAKRKWLKDFISIQEAAIREANDPARKAILDLINRAKILEADFEFGKAIEVYDEMLAKINEAGIKDPKLDEYVKHVKNLKADWAEKGPEHKAARKFIYDTWPNLPPEDLKRGVPRAREALQTCRNVNVKDKLSLQKLAKVALDHDAKLKQKRSELNPDLSTDDTEKAREIEAVLDDLAKLLQEVNEALQH